MLSASQLQSLDFFLEERAARRAKQQQVEDEVEAEDHAAEDAKARQQDMKDFQELNQPPEFNEKPPLPDDASEMDYTDLEETTSDAEAKAEALNQFHVAKEVLRKRLQNEIDQETAAARREEEAMLQRGDMGPQELNDWRASTTKHLQEQAQQIVHQLERFGQANEAWERQFLINRLRSKKGKDPINWEIYNDYLERKAAHDASVAESLVSADRGVKYEQFLAKRQLQRDRYRELRLEQRRCDALLRDKEAKQRDVAEWVAMQTDPSLFEHSSGLNAGLTAYVSFVGDQGPSSNNLVDALASMNLQYQVVDVQQENAPPRALLTMISGISSLPQLFVGNTPLGGWEAIETAMKAGDFPKVLHDAGYAEDRSPATVQPLSKELIQAAFREFSHGMARPKHQDPHLVSDDVQQSLQSMQKKIDDHSQGVQEEHARQLRDLQQEMAKVDESARRLSEQKRQLEEEKKKLEEERQALASQQCNERSDEGSSLKDAEERAMAMQMLLLQQQEVKLERERLQHERLLMQEEKERQRQEEEIRALQAAQEQMLEAQALARRAQELDRLLLELERRSKMKDTPNEIPSVASSPAQDSSRNGSQAVSPNVLGFRSTGANSSLSPFGYDSDPYAIAESAPATTFPGTVTVQKPLYAGDALVTGLALTGYDDPRRKKGRDRRILEKVLALGLDPETVDLDTLSIDDTTDVAPEDMAEHVAKRLAELDSEISSRPSTCRVTAEEMAELACRRELEKKEAENARKRAALERKMQLRHADIAEFLEQGYVPPDHPLYEAIVSIQAAWRGYLDREYVKGLKEDLDEEDFVQQQEQNDLIFATTRLQAIRRGTLARRRVREMKWQVFKKQRDAQLNKEREAAEARERERQMRIRSHAERSAIRIQTWFRRYHAWWNWPKLRTTLRNRKYKRLKQRWVSAAICIQSAWRMWNARMAVEEMHAAATQVQAWWRGCMVRADHYYFVKLCSWGRAARKIQRWWRGILFQEQQAQAVMEYEYLCLAANHIQRVWRGHCGRKQALAQQELRAAADEAWRQLGRALDLLVVGEEGERAMIEAQQLNELAQIRSQMVQEHWRTERAAKAAQDHAKVLADAERRAMGRMFEGELDDLELTAAAEKQAEFRKAWDEALDMQQRFLDRQRRLEELERQRLEDETDLLQREEELATSLRAELRKAAEGQRRQAELQRLRAEQEARMKADEEARAKAEEEARAKAEQEAFEKALQEALAREQREDPLEEDEQYEDAFEEADDGQQQEEHQSEEEHREGPEGEDAEYEPWEDSIVSGLGKSSQGHAESQGTASETLGEQEEEEKKSMSSRLGSLPSSSRGQPEEEQREEEQQPGSTTSEAPGQELEEANSLSSRLGSVPSSGRSQEGEQQDEEVNANEQQQAGSVTSEAPGEIPEGEKSMSSRLGSLPSSSRGQSEEEEEEGQQPGSTTNEAPGQELEGEKSMSSRLGSLPSSSRGQSEEEEEEGQQPGSTTNEAPGQELEGEKSMSSRLGSLPSSSRGQSEEEEEGQQPGSTTNEAPGQELEEVDSVSSHHSSIPSIASHRERQQSIAQLKARDALLQQEQERFQAEAAALAAERQRREQLRRMSDARRKQLEEEMAQLHAQRRTQGEEAARLRAMLEEEKKKMDRELEELKATLDEERRAHEKERELEMQRALMAEEQRRLQAEMEAERQRYEEQTKRNAEQLQQELEALRDQRAKALQDQLAREQAERQAQALQELQGTEHAEELERADIEGAQEKQWQDFDNLAQQLGNAHKAQMLQRQARQHERQQQEARAAAAQAAAEAAAAKAALEAAANAAAELAAAAAAEAAAADGEAAAAAAAEAERQEEWRRTLEANAKDKALAAAAAEEARLKAELQAQLEGERARLQAELQQQMEAEKAQLQAEREELARQRAEAERLAKAAEAERQQAEAERRAAQEAQHKAEEARKAAAEQRQEEAMRAAQKAQEAHGIPSQADQDGTLTPDESDADLTQPAITIQRVYRGHLGRDKAAQRVKQERQRQQAEAAAKAQAEQQARMEQRQRQEQAAQRAKEREQARKMQAEERRLQAEKEAAESEHKRQKQAEEEKEKKRQEQAATKIQAAYRGHLDRAYVRALKKKKPGSRSHEKATPPKAQHKTEDKAATKIQKRWRGALDRMHLQQKMAAAERIQAAVRGAQTRKHVTAKRKHDLMTSHYGPVLGHIIKIQSWWRGVLTREWFRKNRVYLEIARARRTVRKTLRLLGPTNQELPPAASLVPSVPAAPPQPQAVSRAPSEKASSRVPSVKRKAGKVHKEAAQSLPPSALRSVTAAPVHYSSVPDSDRLRPIRATTPPPHLEPLSWSPAASLPPVMMAQPQRMLEPGHRPSPARSYSHPRGGATQKPVAAFRGAPGHRKVVKAWADPEEEHPSPRSILLDEIKQRKSRIDALNYRLAGRVENKVDELMKARMAAAAPMLRASGELLPPIKPGSSRAMTTMMTL